MPRVSNELFIYGYIRAKMGEIQEINNDLLEPANSFSQEELSRNDPSYIGNSEIYMNTMHRKPIDGQHFCPKCKGYHRMIHCTTFLRAGL